MPQISRGVRPKAEGGSAPLSLYGIRMQTLSQSPTDPEFVQNPWPFYDRARAQGAFFRWADYGDLPCALSHAAVSAILRDRRMGREVPPERRAPVPDHQRPFYAIEDHSMLELEPPRHTRLRALVLRAFTTRRIAALAPEIEALAQELVDGFPASGSFDLLERFCQTIPVVVICRLLGVPEALKDTLLAWSHDMVGMYQAGRDRAMEERAATAAAEFAAFLRSYIDQRRRTPGDDLISELIAARDGEGRLSEEELIATCVLLLNAGHEATVHALGNGTKAILEAGGPRHWLAPAHIEATSEEILRFDPPLHMFRRQVYEPVEVMGMVLEPGTEVACLLGAAGRDPGVWENPHRFDPGRPEKPHLAFGAGLHFCVGAPLARLEMQHALPVLFARCPGLELVSAKYADTYHFHGLETLCVRR